MKVVNYTAYRTDDMRRILSACAKQVLEIEKRKRVIVHVEYSRGGTSGCASIGGRVATLRVPHPQTRAWNPRTLKPRNFACLAVHEFRHLNGWTHKQMPATYSSEDAARYAWADTMGIRQQEAKRKGRPHVSTKLAHAERNAQTRAHATEARHDDRAQVGRKGSVLREAIKRVANRGGCATIVVANIKRRVER